MPRVKDLMPIHIQEEEKQKRKKKRIIFCMLFTLLIGGLIGLTHVPRLYVQSIVVTGNLVTDTDSITREVNAVLAQKYFYILPKKNIALVPTDALETRLSQAFPRFAKVTVVLSGRTLFVKILERKGVYTWCDGDAADILAGSSEGNCYFIDETGLVFAHAPVFSGSLFYRFFHDSSVSFSGALGTSLGSLCDTANALLYKDVLDRASIDTVGVACTDGMYTFYLPKVKDTTTILSYITLDMHTDRTILLENLKRIFSAGDFATMYAAHKDTLEYVDARLPNKIFYKFTTTH
jgi:hypothetical protein